MTTFVELHLEVLLEKENRWDQLNTVASSRTSSQSAFRDITVFAKRYSRGARLVPLESRGPQNLFDVYRSAKPTVNLRHSVGGRPQNLFDVHRSIKPTVNSRHWVGRVGLKAMLRLWPHIDEIRYCVTGKTNGRRLSFSNSR
ncbi:hypothetical protein AVEN_43983-1 [Araneus ventricosus]|uniref:Uncharacterized protein n=1 Tax=Araneus ventricosus TaxID=182803 RepID=A0A4Y2UFJ0_ARAVE|nr:hypothetical protein AVEN_43983-1 [Araneus ventricosus]